ncbi:hypothetical protein Bca101_010817 [Brassica carinata]
MENHKVEISDNTGSPDKAESRCKSWGYNTNSKTLEKNGLKLTDAGLIFSPKIEGLAVKISSDGFATVSLSQSPPTSPKSPAVSVTRRNPHCWSNLPLDLKQQIIERLSFTNFERAKSACSSWK